MEITRTFGPTTRQEWRNWLSKNHAEQTEIWLLLEKQPGSDGLTYLDAVEEAICFGWIDGIGKRYSEAIKAQRVTPRRPRSNWTELNKERARRLMRLGLMTPAGEATLPDLTVSFELAQDIEEAIKSVNGAWKHFESFPDLYKRVRIGYIEEMRRRDPVDFEKRIRNFVKQTAAGKMFGNWNDGGRLTEAG